MSEAWEGWLATCAGPIYRSRFDHGKYERTVEGILAAACYSLPPAAADRHLIFSRFPEKRRRNAQNSVWDRRDLFNILYGTPPMYMFDMAICPAVRRLGYEEMISHEYPSEDHAIQRTKWASGAEITVDFNKMSFVLKP